MKNSCAFVVSQLLSLMLVSAAHARIDQTDPYEHAQSIQLMIDVDSTSNSIKTLRWYDPTWTKLENRPHLTLNHLTKLTVFYTRSSGAVVTAPGATEADTDFDIQINGFD